MTLGNGVTMEGTSYFPESISFTNLTLYYGKGNMSKAICSDKSLDRNDVAGKVVICDSYLVDSSQQISRGREGSCLCGHLLVQYINQFISRELHISMPYVTGFFRDFS